MDDTRGRLKRFLSAQAGVRLAQLGYSELRAQHAKREAWWWLHARATALSKRRGLVAGKGVVWTGAGRAELLEIEVPRAGPNEVTVEIAFSAVSTGTERAQFLGLPNARVPFPHRPGYSAAGRVVDVGKGVRNLKVGDYVAATGVPHASVATVPADKVYPLPTGTPLSSASMIVLGVVARQGVRLAEIQPGDTVCVLGTGVVGALAQRLAVEAGADNLIVVARTDRHRHLAHSNGASRFVSLEDTPDKLEPMARVVIEATGDPSACEAAVNLCTEAGTVVLLGSPRGVTNDFPVHSVREKLLRVVGAHVATLDLETASTGADAYRREASAFLTGLAEATIEVSDLLALVNPLDAGVFYRDLALDTPSAIAVFDWLRLPSEDRIRPARSWRLPDVAARGLDREHEIRKRPKKRQSSDFTDPFAGASGELRIGLLGCGDIAVLNAAAVAAAPNARLVACYDPVLSLARQLGSDYEMDVTADVEAMLDRKDIDAVFVCVPHDLHAPLAVAALEADKHVIVEKPPANTLAGAEEMVEAAERSGRSLTICFPHRFEPHVQAAHRLVANGALGEFTGAFVRIFAEKPPSYWFGGFSGRSHSDWRMSRERSGGGILIMNLSHLIDLVRFLTGRDPVSVSTGLHAGQGVEVEDTVSVAAQYANGAVGTFVGSSSVPGILGESELRIWGNDGTIEVEPGARAFSLRTVNGLTARRWQDIAGGQVDPRAIFVSRFATSVARGEPPEVGPNDALAVQSFVEAAYRSHELARAINPAELLDAARGERSTTVASGSRRYR